MFTLESLTPHRLNTQVSLTIRCCCPLSMRLWLRERTQGAEDGPLAMLRKSPRCVQSSLGVPRRGHRRGLMPEVGLKVWFTNVRKAGSAHKSSWAQGLHFQTSVGVASNRLILSGWIASSSSLSGIPPTVVSNRHAQCCDLSFDVLNEKLIAVVPGHRQHPLEAFSSLCCSSFMSSGNPTEPSDSQRQRKVLQCRELVPYRLGGL